MSCFVEFSSAVAEKSKMDKPIRDKGDRLVFVIGPKTSRVVEDLGILLPVKFRCIPFCGTGVRGDVENKKVYAGRRTDDAL